MLTALGRVYLASTPTEVNKNVPVGAVEWLKENKAGGHLFNSYNWGGYLAWSLPQSPVFIDGRADLFGNELINDWWNVVDGTPQGFAILDQWKVQTILLEPSWPIIKLLPSAGWREVYQDQHGSNIYQRKIKYRLFSSEDDHAIIFKNKFVALALSQQKYKQIRRLIRFGRFLNIKIIIIKMI